MGESGRRYDEVRAMHDMKSLLTMTVALSVGITMLGCAGAISLQTGYLVDAAGGVGAIYPAEATMYVLGLILIASGVSIAVWRAGQRRRTPAPGTR